MTSAGSGRILQPGINCWRIEHTHRFAPIIDAATYFRIARQAMLHAQHRIMLIGWEFDTRVRLDRCDRMQQVPVRLGAFIGALAERRPQLEIFILQWRAGFLQAFLRGRTPFGVLGWALHRRIHFKLAGDHPKGACHHEKLIVVDDAVAFCGGIDITGDRWDTPRHRDRDPHRRRPSGRSYGPFHDVATAMDGAAARALGDLARERWRRATGRALAPVSAGSSPWPRCLEPLVQEVDVAIARTEPLYDKRPEVREIEALYLSAIAAAKRSIYLESQYFASRRIAQALARRLGEPQGPEVIVINPESADGWLQEIVMGAARARWLALIKQADRHGRFRIYTPATDGGKPIYVHAKVMVIDDRLLRVGSSNLNNRSMGFDTECDVALEASQTHAADAPVRQAIVGLRDRLIAEHLGIKQDVFSTAVAQRDSLAAAIEALRTRAGRSLVPFIAPPISEQEALIAEHEHLDPERPRRLGGQIKALLKDLLT